VSFVEARIEEYFRSTTSNVPTRTEVRVAEARTGGLDIVIVPKDLRLAEGRGVSEEEIERQLAEEGLIRRPQAGQRPLGEFKRIDVGGIPMSQMIIEERR
jgi:hypothetical protein